MKRIDCTVDSNDFIQLDTPSAYGSVDLSITEKDKQCTVELKPESIRKLRKQLKRVLKEIEGRA
ncbi:COMM domain-containing protein [Bacillus wiedmannii]|uniref:COMM domain-containing protein n=1 Tax=Bacillus wiedmannii TaxID=1890302 RepID=UPI000CD98395|nr:COMM domain-containing protein [Bacillus wiedmannii]MBG9829696.1 hypothetical protein [Bacillus wiedmannii]UOB95764.1 hypothetical protein BTI679_31070 [Bacillus wiedmannii]